MRTRRGQQTLFSCNVMFLFLMHTSIRRMYSRLHVGLILYAVLVQKNGKKNKTLTLCSYYQKTQYRVEYEHDRYSDFPCSQPQLHCVNIIFIAERKHKSRWQPTWHLASYPHPTYIPLSGLCFLSLVYVTYSLRYLSIICRMLS